jgi:hypothetical protein
MGTQELWSINQLRRLRRSARILGFTDDVAEFTKQLADQGYYEED